MFVFYFSCERLQTVGDREESVPKCDDEVDYSEAGEPHASTETLQPPLWSRRRHSQETGGHAGGETIPARRVHYQTRIPRQLCLLHCGWRGERQRNEETRN